MLHESLWPRSILSRAKQNWRAKENLEKSPERGQNVYPDDPRPHKSKSRPSVREQLVVVLIAIGVAIVVTLFAGVVLYLGSMMQ